MEKKIALRMHELDNVATALSAVSAGEIVSIKASDGSILCEIPANGDIIRGHKIALTDIGDGEEIIKYGFAIGAANGDIKKGDYIHTHNDVSQRGRGDLV